jgi:hypothetical protein
MTNAPATYWSETLSNDWQNVLYRIRTRLEE